MPHGMFPVLYSHPPPPAQVQKRPSTEVEDPPSKAKKARTKSKATDGNGKQCKSLHPSLEMAHVTRSILKTRVQFQKKE